MAELNSEWKYKITINEKDWEQVQKWCEIYIGEFDKQWYKLGMDIAQNIFDADYRTTWLFKEEKDVIMFKLRWA
jgi:hypothetical protein